MGLRGVVDALGDADTNAVRMLAEQVPEESDVTTRYRGGNVRGCVAKTDGEDLGSGGSGQQRGTERKDSTAVCRCALGEDCDGAVRVLQD